MRERVLPALDSIPEERKRELSRLALFLETKLAAHEPANALFICTHNSRRSHMSQLWSSAAAAWYGVDGVGTFSGGTEATAFNPRAVAALRRAGFVIDAPATESENPHYLASFSPDGPRMECFSKRYSDPPNPTSGFAAVMTCSQADQNCPVVQGATLRVRLPFEDPKAADGTPEESARYDERCLQIATEMFFLFSRMRG